MNIIAFDEDWFKLADGMGTKCSYLNQSTERFLYQIGSNSRISLIPPICNMDQVGIRNRDKKEIKR